MTQVHAVARPSVRGGCSLARGDVDKAAEAVTFFKGGRGGGFLLLLFCDDESKMVDVRPVALVH